MRRYLPAFRVLALSLALIWGFGGILCFGQTSFFGLGAYAYAVAATQLSATRPGRFPVALIDPDRSRRPPLAGLMFYGRISDVYMGVITLTVTLILNKVAASTSGEDWTIGRRCRSAGSTAIPATPPLEPAVPSPTCAVDARAGVHRRRLLRASPAMYVIAKLLLHTRFGRVCDSDPRQRAARRTARLRRAPAQDGRCSPSAASWPALAGHAVRQLRLRQPERCSRSSYAGQVIIWVLVGGLGTLAGPGRRPVC